MSQQKPNNRQNNKHSSHNSNKVQALLAAPELTALLLFRQLLLLQIHLILRQIVRIPPITLVPNIRLVALTLIAILNRHALIRLSARPRFRLTQH